MLVLGPTSYGIIQINVRVIFKNANEARNSSLFIFILNIISSVFVLYRFYLFCQKENRL